MGCCSFAFSGGGGGCTTPGRSGCSFSRCDSFCHGRVFCRSDDGNVVANKMEFLNCWSHVASELVNRKHIRRRR